ncbi:MAG: ATP-dependent RecD-like DNA helicase [Desulfarculaceae bacterium]|jgi:exodeoxyribonuclease V alpha subunit
MATRAGTGGAFDKPAQLRGRVARITFQNPENGYTVAKVQAQGSSGLITLVGSLPGVGEGQDIEAKGREILHPKFGLQVEVESFRIIPPSGVEGVKQYLASGLIKGVGPKLAQRIVEGLGPEALEIILNEHERLAQLPGFGSKRAQAIHEAVKSHGQMREFMVFLQAHGVGAATALRIFRNYGAGALGVVKNDPHRLASDIRGIGFKTADRIAAKLGLSSDHPSRLQAGLIYTLRHALDEGHVFLPYEELFQAAAQLLNVPRGLLGPAFARLHNDQEITQEEIGGVKAVYLTGMKILEERAAQGLARMAKRPGLLNKTRAAKAAAWVSTQLSLRPTTEQKKALAILLGSGLSILTGGPGTGKTTLVRALLAVAERMGASVALAAPTGRAAKRMQEATGHQALTLHRLLEYSPQKNLFLRNASRPLNQDLAVIDESSMIDTWLLAHLVEALGPTTRLVLVGDADQLPSVGPGLTLRQLISSGVVNVAQLQEIFRQQQAGMIVANAHRILHGQMPRLPRPGQEADFYFVDEPDSAKAAEKILDLVCKRLPAKFGLDPLRDIQVLSPMHRGGLGCENLNRLLRQGLNPKARADLPFDQGDKVMQVRNNYDLEAFNGDLGFVSERQASECRVALGERMVVYNQQDMDDLNLAYAITIHKSQGSEYPAVVIALGMEHYIMLNRPLLYTAVTRGKKLVLIVGNPQALKRAVEHAQPSRRYAALDVRLNKQLQSNTL